MTNKDVQNELEITEQEATMISECFNEDFEEIIEDYEDGEILEFLSFKKFENWISKQAAGFVEGGKHIEIEDGRIFFLLSR